MMLKHEGPITPAWVKREQWALRAIMAVLMLGLMALMAGCARPAAVRTEFQQVVVERPVPCLPAAAPDVPGKPQLSGRADADSARLAAYADTLAQIIGLLLVEAKPCRGDARR